MRLCDFPILTFDTYGTLIDWETGIWDALQPLCARLIDPPAREAALAAFAQSLFHDHVPAKAIGLTTVWIDRRAGRGGGATAPTPEVVEPDFRFKSMAELVAHHRAERA